MTSNKIKIDGKNYKFEYNASLKKPKVERLCPRCLKYYTEHPATSRLDGTSEICRACGREEALEAFSYYLINEQTRKNRIKKENILRKK